MTQLMNYEDTVSPQFLRDLQSRGTDMVANTVDLPPAAGERHSIRRHTLSYRTEMPQ